MKINFVSFSDFSSDIEVYDLKKMDLFVYLLVEIIKKGSDKTIKDVLLDLDITSSLLYLYQNNFYYLLDNGLIINNSDSEDIASIKVNEVRLSEFGKLCLEKKCVIELRETKTTNIKYDLFSDRLVSENVVNDSSNIVVINEEINYFDLINKYKKEILSRYDDNFILNYKNKEANPYYFSVNVDSNNLDKYKSYLKINGIKAFDDKKLDESKKEFMSDNFKVKLFYGKESNLVNSEYSLIVSEENKFKISSNKIYIEEIVKELSDYSFVSVTKNMFGYKVGSIEIDNESYCVFEKERIKDYNGEIKKYLIRNKEKFSDLKLIDKVIDLL